MEIIVEKTQDPNESAFLWARLREHGLEKLSNPSLEYNCLFSILVKEAEEIIGGMLGEIYYKGLHISLLWVREDYRNKGVGTILMEKAEGLARETESTVVYLDTFSFQAPRFYEKLGFSILGQIENFPEGYTRFFLFKRIL
ncbi:MAG TPA: GNAT family N-acetyltransferase [Leptospiraceae bacterium]|nr:GNAT family N-acetyltransferase [Leptospiraceae bacterium]HMW03845.1 GNAT family N-acetyltransferase [Leptospiraceae bacterium]HMX32894.1 GNAT family N-acetyltransferase [Leptospiraceae bacterium]HMY29825.1 GNAT family N-acetyltransferase [Leptospiraceae bacterium]HMZ65193.1 GNAT family N-acetyltransferase [Leptospiraceae bacterium]